MAKELDFEGARLIFGGGNITGGVYKRRFYTIVLADGSQYQRSHFAIDDELGLMGWEKWHETSAKDYRSSHYRKASKPARMQLQKWLYAHPDYLPDGGPHERS